MVDLDNPAQMLEEQLLAFKKQPGGLAAFNAWASVWDLDRDTLEGRARFLSGVADLMDLTRTVRARAELGGPIHEQALEKFPQIETCVFGMLTPNNQVSANLNHVDAAGWFALDLLSRLFANDGARADFTQNDEQGLITQTRDLIDQVVAAVDLSVEVRDDLVTRLREVEDLIRRARLRGSDSLQAAADGLFGCVVRLWVRTVEVGSHPVFVASINLITALATFTGMGADIASLADGGLAKLLELGPGAGS